MKNIPTNAGFSLGTGDLTSDPKFQAGSTNPSTANFQLKVGSPGLNSGTADSNEVPTDFSGTARPQGGGYDRGAYEQ